ncbi:MAG: hypothetical protein IKI37_03295 [Oscillospiraceae bacterium]|nr:hypothetical protein [Oscillospiraceae bacterium]MBR7084187.1 hypothetical protein [Oscillospiraceae bacterium]
MNLEELMNQVTHPEDVTNTFYPEDMKTNQVAGILASFPVLFWLPLVMAQESPYGKFCANQGFILLMMNIAFSIAMSIVSVIFSHIPLIGGILNWVVSLAVFAVTAGAFLLLFVSACQGKARKIPFAGNLFELFK